MPIMPWAKLVSVAVVVALVPPGPVTLQVSEEPVAVALTA
jgi:hypothetical protein